MRRSALLVPLMLVRLTGAFQILSGLLFWTGNVLPLVPIHMLSGLILVLSLWALAIMALVSGVRRGLAVLSGVWGLIVVALGATQTAILPGNYHWVIHVLHLAVGLAAMGLAQGLYTALKTGAPLGQPSSVRAEGVAG